MPLVSRFRTTSRLGVGPHRLHPVQILARTRSVGLDLPVLNGRATTVAMRQIPWRTHRAKVFVCGDAMSLGLPACPRKLERHLSSNVGDDRLGNRFSLTRAPRVLIVAYECFYSSNRMAYADNVSGSEGFGLPRGEFLEEFLPRHASTSGWPCSVDAVASIADNESRTVRRTTWSSA